MNTFILKNKITRYLGIDSESVTNDIKSHFNTYRQVKCVTNRLHTLQMLMVAHLHDKMGWIIIHIYNVRSQTM